MNAQFCVVNAGGMKAYVGLLKEECKLESFKFGVETFKVGLTAQADIAEPGEEAKGLATISNKSYLLLKAKGYVSAIMENNTTVCQNLEVGSRRGQSLCITPDLTVEWREGMPEMKKFSGDLIGMEESPPSTPCCTPRVGRSSRIHKIKAVESRAAPGTVEERGIDHLDSDVFGQMSMEVIGRTFEQSNFKLVYWD